MEGLRLMDPCRLGIRDILDALAVFWTEVATSFVPKLDALLGLRRKRTGGLPINQVG